MKYKSTFNKQTLSRILECSSCVAVGIVLGILLIRFPSFEFEWKFNVIDFLTILLTFVILFHLQNVVTNRVSDDRIEKDILINATKSIATRLGQIRESCHASATGDSLVAVPGPALSQFKDLNNELHSLQLLLDLTPITLDMTCVRKIRRDCLKIKQLATTGGYPHKHLTPEENTTVQLKINATIALVYRTIFYINRL